MNEVNAWKSTILILFFCRFLKFHGSSYETDPEIRALEEKVFKLA